MSAELLAIADRTRDSRAGEVNAIGAVGTHFDPSAARILLREIRRVLRPGGLALLDAGPGGTSPGQLEALAAETGFNVCGRARSCIFDRYWQYCCRSRLEGRRENGSKRGA